MLGMKLILISIIFLQTCCQNLLTPQFYIKSSIDSFNQSSNSSSEQIAEIQPENLQAKMNISNLKLKTKIKQDENYEQRLLVHTNQEYQPSQGLKMTYLVFKYMSYFILLISIFSCKLVGLQLFGVIQFSFLIMANFPTNYPSINVFSGKKQLNGYNLQKIFQNYNSNLPNGLINNGYTSSLFAVNFNVMLALMIILVMIWLILSCIASFIQSELEKQKQLKQKKSQEIIGQITNLSIMTQNQKKFFQTSKGVEKSSKNIKFSSSLNKNKIQEEMSIDNSLQQKSSKYNNRDYILENQLSKKQPIKKLQQYCQKIEYILKRQFFVALFIFNLPNATFSCGVQLYYQIEVIFQVQKISIATISGLCLLLYFIMLGIAFYILCTHQKTKYQIGQLKIKLKSTNWGKSYLLVMALQSFLINNFLAFLNDSNTCAFLILTVNILFLAYILGLQPYKKNIQNYRSVIINSGKTVISVINIIYRNCNLSLSTDLVITILEFCFLFILISITLGFLIRQICYGCVADTQPDFQQKLAFLKQTKIFQTECQQLKKDGAFTVHLIKVGNTHESQNISNITNNQSHISMKKINKKAQIHNCISNKKVTNIDDQQIEQDYYRNQNRKETQNNMKNRLKRIKIYVPKKKKVQFNQQTQNNQEINQNYNQTTTINRSQILNQKNQQLSQVVPQQKRKNITINQNNDKNRVKVQNRQRREKTLTNTIRINHFSQDKHQKENTNISFKQL